jgi:hypothetical protein
MVKGKERKKTPGRIPPREWLVLTREGLTCHIFRIIGQKINIRINKNMKNKNKNLMTNFYCLIIQLYDNRITV